MTHPDFILRLALGFYVGLNAVYPLFALNALRPLFRPLRWETSGPTVVSDELPPITLLRPLKSGVPALRAKLDTLVAAMRPGDQLVLGADEGSAEMDVCAAVRAAFPEREIFVTGCHAGAALNPKISKLVQMTPHARHGHWILSDSEAVIDVAWLDAFRREWLAGGADALTAGYRFINLATWPQRLDAAAALCGLWPGLAPMRKLGPVNFTLGACTALHGADVEAVGGWADFGDFLAEDNRLGAALTKAGRTIRLSAQVATLDSDPLTWRDYWRHQRRVAVTYRVCSPAGFAGMILANGIVGCVVGCGWDFALQLDLESFRCLLLIVLIQLFRWMGFLGLGKMLRFSIPWLFPVMLAANAVEIACWCAAWCDRRVWWAGRRWSVSREGRLSPEQGPS